MRWLVRNDRDHEENSARVFELFLLGAVEEFNCTYTNETRSAAAIWIPPGKKIFAGLRDIPLLLRLIPRVGLRNLFGRLHGNDVMEKHYPSAPHYHLLAVGVCPEAQGKRIGSSIIQPVLEICDKEKLPAYLETSNLKNLAFYQRFQFKLHEEFPLPHGGPVIWTMWREPQSSNSSHILP